MSEDFLVAEVGLVTTGSRGNVCEVVCLVRRDPIRPAGAARRWFGVWTS